MNSTGDRFTLNLDLNPESDQFFIMNLHGSITNSSLLLIGVNTLNRYQTLLMNSLCNKFALNLDLNPESDYF